MPEHAAERDALLRLAAELRDMVDRIDTVIDSLGAAPPPPPAAPSSAPAAAPPIPARPAHVPGQPAHVPGQPQPSPLPPPIPVPPAEVPAPPAGLPGRPVPVPGLLAPLPPVVGRDGHLAHPVAAPAPPATVDWGRLGLRSVPWLGGAVTVLGVVLLLVLAAQRDLIGPGPRMLAGAALGAALLAAAARVHRNPAGRAGSFALAATGFAALYLDTVAATTAYAYLTPAAGLLAGLVVAGAGLFVADRRRSQGLAVFVVLAAALSAPVVTAGPTPLLVAFLLVLGAVATPVRLRRDWWSLSLASTVPVLVGVLALDAVSALRGTNLVAGAVVALVVAAGFVGLAVTSVLHDPDDRLAPAVVAAAPVPVLGAAPLLATPAAVGALLLVTAPLVAIWGVRTVVEKFPARFAGSAGVAGAVALGQATVVGTLAHGPALPVTLLGQAILLAVAARQARSVGALAVAGCYCVAGAGTALATTIPPRLLAAPVGAPGPAAIVTAALVTAATLVLARVGGRLPRPLPPVAWLGLGLVALYGFTATILSVALTVAPDATGFRIGHLVVTIGWAACALLLLARGVLALPARVTGLALVGAAVGKLLLFDLERLDGLVRVAACIGVGVVLLVAGVRYARAVAAAQRDVS